MDLDTRIKSRCQVKLDTGEDVGFVLPRGLLLRGGDCLSDSEQKYIIKIVAKKETVSTAYCDDPLRLARICYHLGNRHVPLEITQSYARFQHDHVLDEMLEQMGVKVTVEQAPFEPEAGAYSNQHGGHSHGDHSHSHNH